MRKECGLNGQEQFNVELQIYTTFLRLKAAFSLEEPESVPVAKVSLDVSLKFGCYQFSAAVNQS